MEIRLQALCLAGRTARLAEKAGGNHSFLPLILLPSPLPTPSGILSVKLSVAKAVLVLSPPCRKRFYTANTLGLLNHMFFWGTRNEILLFLLTC